MIEALYQIGKVQNAGSFLEEFVEDIGKGYKHVFKIIFDINDYENIQFNDIELEEYDISKKMKYLYKSKKGNSPDKTPTSKITSLFKTCKLYSRTFDTMLEDLGEKITSTDKNFVEKMSVAFQTYNKQIVNAILERAKERDLCQYKEKEDDYSFKDGAIITLGFYKNNETFYVGDIDHFTNPFGSGDKSIYTDYYYSKSENTFSRSDDKYCYVCKQNTAQVWGFVNTYNFYTVDKQSLVTGGFDKEKAWRNYPVCPDCAEVLNRGKKYIEQNLKYRFCGFNYFLIPDIVLQDKEILKTLLKNLKTYTDFSLSETESTQIDRTEEKIFNDLSKESNFVNFNFLFYEKNNAAFNILLYLQEISPSRLRFLVTKKDDVDNQSRRFDIFKELATKNDPIRLNFSFAFLKEFFPNSKFEGNFDKYFLSIINNIFIGKKISAELLISRFMEKIRPAFFHEDWLEPLVLKSYKILIYIEAINQLDRRTVFMEKAKISFFEFFDENSIFDDDVKKALFLEGVLAQKLLNVQYQERKATPFRARLNGLKIDEKIAKRLLPEMINKLEEYEKNYQFFKEIETAISEYLLNSNFSKYSVDEMSYYFTLGLTLEKHFRKQEEQLITNKIMEN